MQAYLPWLREVVDPRLNGLLVNWYDGAKGHCIGPHRDQAKDLVQGSPIVTVSLGQARQFRLTGRMHRDGIDMLMKHTLVVENGSVVVLSWQVNAVWKHGVPHLQRYQGRPVSITARAFA